MFLGFYLGLGFVCSGLGFFGVLAVFLLRVLARIRVGFTV